MIIIISINDAITIKLEKLIVNLIFTIMNSVLVVVDVDQCVSSIKQSPAARSTAAAQPPAPNSPIYKFRFPHRTSTITATNKQ